MADVLIADLTAQQLDPATQAALLNTVAEGVGLAQQILQEFAQQTNFNDVLGQVFGTEIPSDWQDFWAGSIVDWPPIEIRSAAEINGAYGAFSSNTNTIYLSYEFLLDQGQQELTSSRVKAVLLEEFGHALDARLNLHDSPGDEGEIFAKRVQDIEISESELTSLKNEIDTATVRIDNQDIVIEQATLSGPSPDEVEMLELINRMRMNPQAELPLLLNSSNADVNFALSYFNVNRTVLANQWSSLVPAQPLAWSDELGLSAANHSELMVQYDSQSHSLPGEPSLGARIQNAGYNFSSVAENIYAFGKSVFHTHAAFAIDWGSTSTGIQDPPGHRNNIMNAAYREAGLGIVPETNPSTNVGPLVITQHLGNRTALNGKAWLLGVTFNDQDGDQFYDVGEAVGGITINAVNTSNPALSSSTTSRSAGDYKVLLDPGNYQVNFLQGSTLLNTSDVTISAASPVNVKLDLKSLTSPPPPSVLSLQRWATRQGGFWDSQKWLAGDFTGDGRDDLTKVFDDQGFASIDVHGSTGSAFTGQRWATRQGGFWDSQKWLVGNFNGDGRDDLIKVFNDQGFASLDAHLSSGSGFAIQRWGTQQGGFWDGQKWMVGDFNGDGKDDLIKVFNDQGFASLDAHLSSGSGFTIQRWGTQQGGFWDSQKWMVGDFNGDGRADLAKVFNDQGMSSVDVHLSSGSGFTIQRWATRQGGFWDSQKWLAGKFNSDNRADLAKVFDDQGSTSLDVHLSSGSGFTGERWATRQGGFWDSQKWLVGDFNGGGRDDFAKVFNDQGLGTVDIHLIA